MDHSNFILTNPAMVYRPSSMDSVFPIKPIRLAIFPWRGVVLDVAEHIIQASRRLRFFHHDIATHFSDNLQRIDIYRASLYAGIAGGTCPKFFTGDVII